MARYMYVPRLSAILPLFSFQVPDGFIAGLRPCERLSSADFSI